MNTVSVSDAAKYTTVFASSAHLNGVMLGLLTELAEKRECYFIHSTGVAAGLVIRFGALSSEIEEIREELSSDGFDSDFTDMIEALHSNDIDAVHFDPDFELLEGLPWYEESTGNKIIPLEYNVDACSFWDLSDADQQLVKDNYEDGEEGTYFIYDGNAYSMADCMRMDDSDSLKGEFDGYFTETAFSRLLVKLVDDGEYLNIARETA